MDLVYGQHIFGDKSHSILTNYSFKSNTINMIRKRCDSFQVHSIVLGKTDDINNIKSFKIKIGGNKIWTIPIDIIKSTCKIKKNIIYFDQNIFFDKPGNHIFLFKCYYHEISVSLSTWNNTQDNTRNDMHYDLILNEMHLSSNIRDDLQQKNPCYIIKTYKDISDTLKVNIHRCLGFYIASKIKEFSLSYNGTKLISYSAIVLKVMNCLLKSEGYTNKQQKEFRRATVPIDVITSIESHLNVNYFYWIPIEDEQPIKISQKKLLCDLVFNHDENTIVTAVVPNALLYADGMCCLRYV